MRPSLRRPARLALVPKRPQWMVHRRPAEFDDLPHDANRGGSGCQWSFLGLL